MSTAFGELYDNKGKKITSWNKTDNVVCPKCKSFNYFLKQEEA
jgi:phage FluMu protein Com